jgi:hypothetical protein
MATCQAIVDKARATALNDTDKVRYSDADLMGYLQDGVSRAYALRPDLRYGSYGTTPAALSLGSTFPLPVQHEAVVADYVIARAESRDDENVNANRELKFMQAFDAGITRT